MTSSQLAKFISPLIRQNQSPHHICVNNADSLTVSERTIYRLIDARIISAMNIDLPRKVRYSARKVKCHLKVDKACRIGRTYEDFKGYLLQHPDDLLSIFILAVFCNILIWQSPSWILWKEKRAAGSFLPFTL